MCKRALDKIPLGLYPIRAGYSLALGTNGAPVVPVRTRVSEGQSYYHVGLPFVVPSVEESCGECKGKPEEWQKVPYRATFLAKGSLKNRQKSVLWKSLKILIGSAILANKHGFQLRKVSGSARSI